MVKTGAIMVKTESEFRHLSGSQTQGVFEYCFVNPNFVLVTTTQCSPDLLRAMANRFSSKKSEWLSPLRTYTSRELFTVMIPLNNGFSEHIILKRSRHEPKLSNKKDFEPVAVSNEIKTNMHINKILSELINLRALPVPGGFDSFSVRVETPLGVLVDRQKRVKYSIFVFEKDVYTGEDLQFTDPPIKGAIMYNPRAWKLFCTIKDVLDIITQAATEKGLMMIDSDIHQVLYRVGKDERSLEIILIDSERQKLKIEKRD